VATDRTERLLNLVICLLGASRPVNRAALRDSIPGYGDAASDDAFERMFERDKDELRHMGIPIDTVVNAQGEVEGYLIDSNDYAMPEVALDAAELSVLGVAARVWTEAALVAEAGSALRKVEAITGERLAPPDLLGGRPGRGEEHLPALWEALRQRHTLRFDYLARGRDAAEPRHVEPWATVHREGAWYLVGLSRERGEPRAFRLSRIVGAVAIGDDASDVPAREQVDAVVATIAEPTGNHTARLRLPEHGAARLRDQATPMGDGTWEVDFVDTHDLIAQVIEAGAVILEPESARALQRHALEVVLRTHEAVDA
jgi:proteasome accessory factor B